MMKLGRRALLKASLGCLQLGLIERLASPSRALAQASTDGPTKMLTLFMPGGWMSLFTFCPLTPEEVSLTIPSSNVENGEPIFFDPAQLINLDGTTGSGALVVPRLWDETELSQGRPDRRINGATSPHGWSWVEHRLWENACVVHGVDQGSAAHAAGQVSAMCGVASSEFKSPAMQALAAHHLIDRFPDRAIPSVWIGGPAPSALGLRSEASPSRIASARDVEFLFSDRKARAWTDLRASDVGSTIAPVHFDGTSAGDGFVLNPIEDRTLRRMRALAGMTNAATDRVLESMHEQLVGVSRVLAKDVTRVVEATRGVEHTTRPFWAPPSGHFAVDAAGFGADGGDTWQSSFDLALRLLKADVSTSVAVECPGIARYGFDGGHSQGHRVQFVEVRATFDIVGRLLGEMKATPGSRAGKTLLDDTLVVIISDFARTWPKSGPTSDHWPANSVILAGGGLNANRMFGSYAVDPANPAAQGFDGLPLSIVESTGNVMRRPRSADVVTTALAILGVQGIRIPGGNGEIAGVRAT